MKIVYTLIVLCWATLLQAQTQIGQTISGTYAHEISSMDYSENGSYVITGSIDVIPGPNTSPTHVKVYEKNNGNWVQKGSTIFAPYVYANFGSDVEISDNGNTIMITDLDKIFIYAWQSNDWVLQEEIVSSSGLVNQSITLSGNGEWAAFARYGSNQVTVEFYNLSNNTWSYHSNYTFSGAQEDWSICSLNFTANGDRIVIGTPWVGTQGRIAVLHRNGTNWNPQGSPVFGAVNEGLGFEACISDDGTKIAATTMRDFPLAQSVFVFEWNGNTWLQKGNEITDAALVDDRFLGSSLDLSADGFRLATGYAFHDAAGSQLNGKVAVFDYDGNNWSNTFEIVGDDYLDRIGVDVVLANNGNSVATKGSNYAFEGLVSVYGMTTNCNSFIRVESEMYGETNNDNYGTDVALSGNGEIMAVGTPLDDTNGYSSGSVSIYKRNGITWEQLGNTLNGDASYDYSGSAVSLSYDGNVLAIGAKYNDSNGSNSGQVKVFEYSGGSWNQLGSDLIGWSASDYFGEDLALSPNGKQLIVGASANDKGGTNAGMAVVYGWNGSSWLQEGDAIYGENTYDKFGTAVDISGVNTIVVGAPYNDNGGTNSGSVSTYALQGNKWQLLDYPISGTGNYDQFGRAVAISDNGYFIVAGSWANDNGAYNGGNAIAYQWSGSSWNQHGASIDGTYNNGRLGAAVSINEDGDKVVVGAFRSQSTGKVIFCDYSNGSWIPRAAGTFGNANNDQYGYAVAMCNSGKRIAIGARYNDFKGGGTGLVRTYFIDNCTAPKSLHTEELSENASMMEEKVNTASNINVYPNPATTHINIDVAELFEGEIIQLEVYNAVGKLVLIQSASNSPNTPMQMDVSQLKAGLYMVRVSDGKTIKQQRIMVSK